MSGKGRLIDSNVLVHAYVLSDGRKHAVAKDIVQKLWEDGNGITTLQNRCEFFFVVTKKVENPLPVSRAKAIVSSFLNTSQWQVIDRDEMTFFAGHSTCGKIPYSILGCPYFCLYASTRDYYCYY